MSGMDHHGRETERFDEESRIQELEPIYGTVLHRLVIVGFVLLGLAFLVYAFGLLPSYMEAHRVPEVWDRPAEEAIMETERPPFWAWVTNLDRADLLSLGSLAVLAATTPVGFLFLFRMFWKRRDFAYVTMVVLQFLVLLFAASGIAGSH